MKKFVKVNLLFIIFFLSIFCHAATVNKNSLIVCASQQTVAQTTDQLVKILSNKGVKIFARINFSADAKAVDLPLADEELLIFGNPKAGTLLMQENPEIGAILPLKILVWKNATGQTQVAYEPTEMLTKRFHIQKAGSTVMQMENLMKNLTAQVCLQK